MFIECTPFIARIEFPENIDPETIKTIFDISQIRVKSKATLDGVIVPLENTLDILKYPDEPYELEEDENFENYIAQIFDMYNDAYSGNYSHQVDLLSNLASIGKFKDSLIDEINNSVLHKIIGSMLVATRKADTKPVESEDDDVVPPVSVSFTLIYETCDENVMSVVLFTNKTLSLDLNPIMQGILPTINLTASKKNYVCYSITEVNSFINMVLTSKNPNLNLKNWNMNTFDGVLSLYWVNSSVDELNLKFNKIFDKVVGQALENKPKFYQTIKSCRLFTIDSIPELESDDCFYVNCEFVASELNDSYRDFDWITEDIIEVLEYNFGGDSEIDGIVVYEYFDDYESIPDHSVDSSHLRNICMESLLNVRDYNVDMSVSTDIAERALYSNIEEMYNIIVEKAGTNLLSRNNAYIIDYDEDDNVLDENTCVETNLGTFDLEDLPTWMLLIIMPYVDFLMKSIKSKQELDDFFDESYTWFESPMFTKVIEHVKTLAIRKIN